MPLALLEHLKLRGEAEIRAVEFIFILNLIANDKERRTRRPLQNCKLPCFLSEHVIFFQDAPPPIAGAFPC